MTVHRSGRTQPAQSDRRKSFRVLCVDDDEPIVLLLQRVLENAGHHAECARDGRAAFARVVADLDFFDLIVTDHDMPGFRGLRLVEKLREVKFPGRIIVHSSALRKEDLDAYRAFAVDRILAKPVQLDEFLEAVHAIGETAS
jgi:CheY-like chemotaxis protein